MAIRLWLDDERPAPEAYRWAKTYDDAILELLRAEASDENFFVFQMDHDLKPEHYSDLKSTEHVGTGYDVVCWMEEHHFFPAILIVHSFNPYGSQRMLEVAQKYTQAYYRKYNPNTYWL